MIAIAYAAPFAVFRDFTAGFFRESFRFVPQSVLYGLVLNLMGIEARGPLGPTTTLTLENLPVFEVASAVRSAQEGRHSFAAATGGDGSLPDVGMLFQQLHVLPVGYSNKEWKPRTKGAKHHIAPGRRQVLLGVRGACLVRGDATFEKQLEQALISPPWELESATPRYGLPFLGDNNFMLEELRQIEPDTQAVEWVVAVGDERETGDDSQEAPSVPFRLTEWADRAGTRTTRSGFYRLQPGTLAAPPETAWVRVGPA